MADLLGYRKKFGVVAPSTNTAVQPEYDDMRPRGVTNHFGRIHIPNDPATAMTTISVSFWPTSGAQCLRRSTR